MTQTLLREACSNAYQPFCEEFFPNVQSKHPLVQHEAISSCSITSYLEEETDPSWAHRLEENEQL